jgi:hypothetical protein
VQEDYGLAGVVAILDVAQGRTPGKMCDSATQWCSSPGLAIRPGVSWRESSEPPTLDINQRSRRGGRCGSVVVQRRLSTPHRRARMSRTTRPMSTASGTIKSKLMSVLPFG